MAAVPRALVVGASETSALLHLPVLARLRDEGRIELVEVCDLRAVNSASARRCFGFERDSGDAAAAIAQLDIDLVYLFGGARMHHTLGIAALRAGKHLFVEKPIAPSYAEAQSLAYAAQERGLIAVGGHNRRFLAAFDRIRAVAGTAGWSFAEAAFHKAEFGRTPPFGAATWLSGNGIHALDALVFMMGGLPDRLTSEVGGTGAAPSVFTAMMHWPNGAQGVLLSNNEAGARYEAYAFHGPGESWRVTDNGLTVERNGSSSQLDCSPVGDGFAAEHESFLSAVAKGVEPPHSIAALAPSLFLAELIESGHRGPVRLPRLSKTPPRPHRQHTVLLVNAERQRASLGAMPADWRLLSLEELERTSRSRPEVTAAIFGQGAAPLTAETLDKLPNLRVAGIVGLSLQRFRADHLLDRGITLVNASNAYAESVAEFALGLAILGRRRAFASHEAMRRGGWGIEIPGGIAREAFLRTARRVRSLARKLGIEGQLMRAWRSQPSLVRLSSARAVSSHDLAGAVVGLIGWGANARAFARRLIASGVRVLVHSDHAAPDEIRACGAEPAPLANVLAADIVSLHRGLSPATRHCLGAAELERLRPGAVLINVARGALIEPDALLARLARGDVIACLDTFDEEPLPRRHPLRQLTDVFITSHIAGGSPEMHTAAAREVIDKVAAYLDDRPFAAVTAERLATMT